MLRVYLLGLVGLISMSSFAQKQLLILKGEKVLLRLNFGDPIAFKLKGDKQIKRSYVNNVYETAFKVHQDTILFKDVDRIYFRQSTYWNTAGGLLVTAGVGYFAIDQINEVLVNGNDFNVDDGVVRSSAVLVGLGLPMMLIKKKSQKISYPVRLLMAPKGSPFYVPPRNEKQLTVFPEN